MRRYLLPSFLLVFLLVAVVHAQAPEPDAEAGELQTRAILTLDPGHHVGPITDLHFTPDGKRLVSVGEDKTVQVWNVQSGERLRVLRPPIGLGSSGAIMAAALAPDGCTLAVGGVPVPAGDGEGRANGLYLLNLDDGRILALWRNSVALPAQKRRPMIFAAVGFSRDGDRLAAAVAGQVLLYRGMKDAWQRGPKSWEPMATIELSRASSGQGFPPDGTRLAFAPDGTRLAVTLAAQRAVLWYDVTGPTPRLVARQSEGHTDPLALAWSPDSQRLVSVHSLRRGTGVPPRTNRAVRVWSRDGKSLRDFTGAELEQAGVLTEAHRADPALSIDGVRFRAPAGMLLLVKGARGRSAVLFNLNARRGVVLESFVPYTPPARSATAVTPDGNLAALAAAPEGHRIALLALERGGGEARFLQTAQATSAFVGWLPDGYRIAWGTDAAARLGPRPVRTGRGGVEQATSNGLDLVGLQPVPGKAAQITGPVTERDGWTLRRTGTGSVELVRRDKTVQTLSRPESVHAFTLPARGPVPWFAWVDQRGLHLTDARTGQHTRFLPYGRVFRSVSSSPDGKYLLVYSTRELYHVYRPNVRIPLLNVFVSGSDWVVWTPQGYYAASPNGERLMGWTVNNGLDRLATFYPAEQFRKQLYRPDVIGLLLEKGGLDEAVAAANAARKASHVEVPRGQTDPDKLLPPGVTLTLADKTQLPKVTLTASAQQGCPEQPVKSLRLLVDGRPLPGSQAYLTFPDGQEKPQHEQTWTVELPPGKHQLSVLVRSKDDTPNVSNPIEVSSPLPPDQRPKLHHLAVGINQYTTAPPLQCAAPDAGQLHAALHARAAASTLYRPGTSQLLRDREATRSAVLAAIDAVRKAARPSDLFVFSFAGHGVREEGEFYLLTQEADPKSAATLDRTAVSGMALREKLADFPCQVLLLLDACHAGAFGASGSYRPATDEAARALADVDVRVAVMCATLGHEEALEKDGNGLFTKSILEALKKSPNVIYDPETGEMNVYDLQAFVYREVARASDHKQNPFLKMPLAHPPFVVTQFAR